MTAIMPDARIFSYVVLYFAIKVGITYVNYDLLQQHMISYIIAVPLTLLLCVLHLQVISIVVMALLLVVHGQPVKIGDQVLIA